MQAPLSSLAAPPFRTMPPEEELEEVASGGDTLARRRFGLAYAPAGGPARSFA
jgi:hypothetical protein